MEALEAKLQQWSDYETLKDQCLAWLRETDTKMHAVDLKATLGEKQHQLDILKVTDRRDKILNIESKAGL